MRLMAAAGLLGTLALAGYWTLRLGYADRLYQAGTAASIQAARRLAPGNAAYYRGARAAADTREALRLDPRDAAAWIELGLAAEVGGDLPRAEKQLLEAAQVDRTYEPRWSLANFYFRRGDAANFFRWARSAAEISYQEQGSLFALCWRMTQDPAVILERAIPDRREILQQYLRFLLLRQKLDEAGPVAGRLAAMGSRDSAPLLLAWCDRLLMAERTPEALRAWNGLCARGLTARQPLSPGEGRSLTNGNFSAKPLGLAFDWRLHPAPGVAFALAASPPEIRATLSGNQAPSCRLLEQVVPLEPSRGYRLRFVYRTSDIPPGSGLRWQAVSPRGPDDWSVTGPDLSAEDWAEGHLDFGAPPKAGQALLSLRYDRALGTTRIEGAVWIRDVSLAFR
jgi:tetratricopeptide (TPR) repeat protein